MSSSWSGSPASGPAGAGITIKSPDGLTPAEQLGQIGEARCRAGERSAEALARASARSCGAGHRVDRRTEVTREGKEWLEDYFLRQIFPLLTPLAIDPAHPFPFIPNLGFTIALQLVRASDGKAMNALIRMPQQDRTVHPSSGGGRVRRAGHARTGYGLFIARLFPGYAVKGQGFSGSFATPKSKSRKRRKIWCGSSRRVLEAAATRLGDPARARGSHAGGSARGSSQRGARMRRR